jgi:NADH:ubiquinone oxidoreductase subunit E
MDELDLTFVNSCVESIGTGREKVLEITQNLQEHYGYLPQEALEHVCEITDITPASIMGVTTFYNLFRHRPAGEHIVKICVGKSGLPGMLYFGSGCTDRRGNVWSSNG